MLTDLNKTKGIMDEIGAGTMFDDTLASTIGSLDSGVLDVVSTLKASGIPNVGGIADEIAGKLDVDALGELSSHVGEQLGGTMDKLATFTSFCAMEDAISGALGQASSSLPEIISEGADEDLVPIEKAEETAPSPPAAAPSSTNSNLGKAFGAMLAARSMVSSVATLKASVGEMASLEGALSLASGVLTQAIANNAPPTQIAQAQAAKDNAVSALNSHKEGIVAMATDLSSNLGTIREKIASEKAFFASATSELTKFADATKIQSMFSTNPAAKAVMGALGSTSLLGKLRG